MIFECVFNQENKVFFALQAWLRNFKNAIWTHDLLCLQHVCYFAETSKNRIAIIVFESLSYKFLITFCRGPDLLKISQNTSQNWTSGHPKSKKTRKRNTQKNIKKTTLKKSAFGCKMTSFWDPPDLQNATKNRWKSGLGPVQWPRGVSGLKFEVPGLSRRGS